MKPLYILFATAFTLASCTNSDKKFDATGTFESTETIVYAEQPGRLLAFQVEEGQELSEGQEVGLIDTVQLALQIAQLQSTKATYDAQRPDMAKQIASLQEQLRKAELEVNRYTALVADGAAPRKMLDDSRSQMQVLQKQIVALTSSLNTQQRTLTAQQGTTETQVQQLRDQLNKCHIVAPASGMVLEKYTEPNEFVTMGKPLFKMAEMKDVFLRAYVTSEQLAKIKVGQLVEVSTVYGNGQGKNYKGTIAWISSKSEFTPKTILTDDERASLVYAVKVAVKNDGGIKLGMYGSLKF